MKPQQNSSDQTLNIELNPNIIADEALVETLLQNLCCVQEQDQEANGVSQAAAATLQSIFENGSQQFEAKVLNFTELTIHHQNWKYRQASIRAFSLLLIGLPRDRSQTLVSNSLIELVSLLNDPEQYVQLSTIQSLSLITEYVPEIILRHLKLLQILNFVMQMGKNQLFLKHVAKMVYDLAQPEESSKILGPYADSMIQFFLKLCLEANRSILSIKICILAIKNLIQCSLSAPLCNMIISYVLNTYPQLHKLQSQKRDLFYSGFFTLVHICLMTIRKINGEISMQQLQSLYKLVVEHYKRINGVEGDGFYIVSALTYFIPNDKTIIDDFWQYIQQGLKNFTQENIFKSAISCICDFTITYRENISDKIDPIFSQLLDLYENNLITRELKLNVLQCAGELFLHCGKVYSKHLKRVMRLIHLSCKTVLTSPDRNYSEILQAAIVETLMCIFHGIDNNSIQKDLPNYLSMTVEFIRLTTEKNRYPKLKYLKDCLMLLSDVAMKFPETKNQLSKADFVANRTATLIAFNKDGHLNSAITYIKQQFQLQF